jgi:UDP:flavonoid glycosyltransferase YjiC (YdhE family)
MAQRPITVVLGGSQGDIQPFLYLACELVRAGHPVRICSPGMYQELVEATGAEFLALATSDPRQVAREDFAERQNSGVFARMKKFTRAAEPSADFLELLLAACSGAQLVLCNTVMGMATHVGESLQVPTGIVYFSPFYPTRSFSPPVGPQNLRLGGTFNLLSHLALQEMYWAPNAEWINRWRVDKLHLPALSRWRPPASPALKRFFAFSPSLIPAVPDWPKNNYVTGFWFGPRPTFEPSQDLEAFLSSGLETVAISFGSVLDERVGSVARQAILAARELGFQVIVIGGWGVEVDASTGVYFSSFLPYSWLFPRIRMVVHAAGCGTCAEVLRAGVPSVTVPFAGEQRFWAQRLFECNLGHYPLDWRTANQDALREALNKVRNDDSVLRTAQSFSAPLIVEDGIRRTIDLLLKN